MPPSEHLEIPCHHFPATLQQLRELCSCEWEGLRLVGRQGCVAIPDLQPSKNPGLGAGCGRVIWQLHLADLENAKDTTLLNSGRKQNSCTSVTPALPAPLPTWAPLPTTAISNQRSTVDNRNQLATAAMQFLRRPLVSPLCVPQAKATYL